MEFTLPLPGGAVTLLHLYRFGLKVTVGETWRAFISVKSECSNPPPQLFH